MVLGKGSPETKSTVALSLVGGARVGTSGSIALVNAVVFPAKSGRMLRAFFAEEKSAAIHVRELKAAGFKVATGTSNIPTAFLAEWSQGSGGPKIGFLPEYDALPGLGNAAEPRKTPGPTGFEVGHGCGHNMLGAGCTGAAIALKKMMEQDKTPGTILVFGCAAEEGGAVKAYFARDGLFDDVDAAVAWHPAPIAATGAISTAANNGITVKFFGRTAHAGVEPWQGRSALKAAELFGTGIQFMREHVEPTVRMHYIYEQAGLAANIVPDFAQILLTIRDKNRQNVVKLTEWAKDVADGAALMTQTKAEFQVFTGVHQILPNDTLIALTHRHMTATPIEWTSEEQAFAKTIQKEMNLPEKGLATADRPDHRRKDDRGRIGLRRRQLQYAPVDFRLANASARRCPAHLGRDGLWRYVDWRQGIHLVGHDHGGHWPRSDDQC